MRGGRRGRGLSRGRGRGGKMGDNDDGDGYGDDFEVRLTGLSVHKCIFA